MFGLIIVLWIIFCFVVASTWEKKGLSFGKGFVISLFFSPLVGLLMGIFEAMPAREKNQKETEEKNEKSSEKTELPPDKQRIGLKFNCPKCGKPIIVKFLKVGEIAKCHNCGAEVSVPTDAEKVNLEEFRE